MNDDYCAEPYCGEREAHYLHQPSEECVGCRAPQDHHIFKPGGKPVNDDEGDD